MRDIFSWRKPLARQMLPWPEDAPLSPSEACEVELALCALQELAPDEGASALPALLSGYPFALEARGVPDWSKEQKRTWGNARHLLPRFRNPSTWRHAVESYRALPEYLRGYEVVGDGRTTRRSVSVCSKRHDAYQDALRKPVAHRSRPVHWAGAGEFEFQTRGHGGHLESVRIPSDLVLSPPPRHALRARKRKPLRLSWDDLRATAQWMDEEEERHQVLEAERGRWRRRFDRLRLEVTQNDGAATRLLPSEVLELDGLAHLIGMVSSGKSTLMDVAAVWAARSGLHVTLVVGDVVAQLNRARMFARLGLGVAPILGRANRKRHIERLHRTLAGVQAAPEMLSQFEHEGFRWLSTACPLDALRSKNNLSGAGRPLIIGAQPCLSLKLRGEHEDDDEDDAPRNSNRAGATEEGEACPLYAGCPYHQAQRDLVEAPIWIATPASLVYTQVAPQLNAERVRFWEAALRRSDLIIVDEADQVQVQLDAIFNPSQTLIGRDGWLSSLHERVPAQLNLQRRAPLAQENVGVWMVGHDNAQAASHRIDDLLLQHDDLRHWVEENNYFTDLLLLDQIAQVLEPQAQVLEGSPIRAAIEKFVSDPLADECEGAECDGDLCELARLALTGSHARVRDRARAWIETHITPGMVSPDEVARQAVRLELALLVAVLQSSVNHLLRHWNWAEEPLALEGGASLLSHVPPDDLRALVPEPPMGQVLAFQYVRSSDAPVHGAPAPGELRFFRCMGVGRWMLLHGHEMLAGDGVAGPNVLLLSGTSWAGSSPSYHIQAPVTGVLRAPDEEVEAIHGSLFRFWPQRDESNHPIRISGRQGAPRAEALLSLLRQLAGRSRREGPSLLEQERDDLPEGRRRVLLLVGSYEEARSAYEYLAGRLRPEWRGQMRYLVPDDASFEGEWHGDAGDEGHLRRGLVGELAQTGAWLLIAPLLAVERGHNILSGEGGQAAIGAAFFLVRPHPRPDDIAFAVHSINRWAVDHYADHAWLQQAAARRANSDTNNGGSNGIALGWSEAGQAFRAEAHDRWRELLRQRMQMATLPQSEREAVVWSQLVSIWQVIGRLVRGGSPARVFFCDAQFAPSSAHFDEWGDREATSLLVAMRQVLRPYFTPRPSGVGAQDALVQTLYGPFHAALENIRGLSTTASQVEAESDPDSA